MPTECRRRKDDHMVLQRRRGAILCVPAAYYAEYLTIFSISEIFCCWFLAHFKYN